jgi:hypothetical protein
LFPLIEAAVVGFPHDLKGEGIGCFVILKVGYEGSKVFWNYYEISQFEFTYYFLALGASCYIKSCSS